MKRKEITFRHWFDRKFGTPQIEDGKMNSYNLPMSFADLEKAFRMDIIGYSMSFNSCMKYAKGIRDEVRTTGTFVLPLMEDDVDLDMITPYQNDTLSRSANASGETVEREKFTFETTNMSDFNINPKLFHTGEIIDKIDSTYTEDGGQYGGTVTIVIGESGSGKTTMLLDKLAKYKKINPDAKVLYISTEMTRNDLIFYTQDLPDIKLVEVLIVMDYMRKGFLKQAIQAALEKEWDLIVLDSYEDLAGKLTITYDWKSKYTQRWLVDLMVTSVETFGSAIYAIQHVTKSGVYVGSTFLKHATTAMLELRIDKDGLRYMYYSKNRRGGKMQMVPLYFTLEHGKGIVYDEQRFKNVLADKDKLKETQRKLEEASDEFASTLEAMKRMQNERREAKERGDQDEKSESPDGPVAQAVENEKSSVNEFEDAEIISDIPEYVEFEEMN